MTTKEQPKADEFDRCLARVRARISRPPLGNRDGFILIERALAEAAAGGDQMLIAHALLEELGELGFDLESGSQSQQLSPPSILKR